LEEETNTTNAGIKHNTLLLYFSGCIYLLRLKREKVRAPFRVTIIAPSVHFTAYDRDFPPATVPSCNSPGVTSLFSPEVKAREKLSKRVPWILDLKLTRNDKQILCDSLLWLRGIK
jgi:hypothetical protein